MTLGQYFYQNVLLDSWTPFGDGTVYQQSESRIIPRMEAKKLLLEAESAKATFLIRMFNKYEVDYEDALIFFSQIRNPHISVYYDAVKIGLIEIIV